MPALLLILACALWGVSFPLVKALHLEQTARIPAATSLFLASWMQTARFGLGALMLLPFVFGKSRPTANEIRQGLVIALWGGLGMWVQADALAHTEASTSAFLTQAYCIFLPLWACLRTRRGPGVKILLATAMVLAGGGILSGIRPDHLRLGRGEWETLLAAFLFTFQILSLENPRYQGNRGIPVSFVMFLGIALLFVPVTLITAPDVENCLTAGASAASLLLIAGLALFCSVGAYVLMNVWQPRVPATEAGLIYTIEPVFTALYVLVLPQWLGTLIGADYPNETLTTRLITGGALILAANLLMQWKTPPHLPPAGPV
ncbi:DMT family transporter [Luteolibacter yonseiensis]|uniref:DMT family transporter n=1 Tax=Luteolibacter yonseiensis TaxID=1144680 RepID=A0A934R4N5_9BACT|nr:DMT family transporter [Luteolibacter yonseiensis]MBK1815200.1 DMT family transporter [Luteolibacter yonseiensis]